MIKVGDMVKVTTPNGGREYYDGPSLRKKDDYNEFEGWAKNHRIGAFIRVDTFNDYSIEGTCLNCGFRVSAHRSWFMELTELEKKVIEYRGK